MSEVSFNGNSLVYLNGSKTVSGTNGEKWGEISPKMRQVIFDEPRLTKNVGTSIEALDSLKVLQKSHLREANNYSCPKGEVLFYVKESNDDENTSVMGSCIGIPYSSGGEKGRRELERRIVILGINTANLDAGKLFSGLKQNEMAAYRSGVVDCLINNGEKTINECQLVMARMPKISNNGELSGYSYQLNGHYPLILEPFENNHELIERHGKSHFSTNFGFLDQPTDQQVTRFLSQTAGDSDYQRLSDIASILHEFDASLVKDLLLASHDRAITNINSPSRIKFHGFENLIIGMAYSKAYPGDSLSLLISKLLN